MENLDENKTAVGRANVAIIFGQGADEKAVITSVVVRHTANNSRSRLNFRGAVQFAKETKTHYQTILLPLVDQLCAWLSLRTGSFILSGVNVGAASSHDLAIEMTGWSADVAVFLALLSARLEIPLRQNVVYTGAIASLDGDVRPVRNLLAKLKAVQCEKSIERFIYPALDADASVATLTPGEFTQISAVLNQPDNGLKLIPIQDVEQLLRAILTEEDVVRAALANGYFNSR